MVLRVRWVLLFGGIALFAVVLYAILGVWLWRRAKALALELGEAQRKLDAGLPDAEQAALSREDEDSPRGTAGAGQRP